MTASCIFCRIAKGEIPSTRIYEDYATVAFLDINPVSKGHTLVVPRFHAELLTGLPADALQRLILSVQKIARAQYKGLDAAAINVTQANGAKAGQCVAHVHFHVIPRYPADPDHHWKPGAYADERERDQYASRIRAAVE